MERLQAEKLRMCRRPEDLGKSELHQKHLVVFKGVANTFKEDETGVLF